MRRNASLDLLRLIAMWFILTAHFLGWGGAVNTLTPHDFNYYWVMPIYFMSQIGNTLFFMLAGYFAGKPRLEKALLLERKTALYSTIIAWIVFLLGDCSLSYAIHSMFPLVFKKYWFVSVYLVLYALGFVLVPGLKSLTKRQCQVVIIALLANNTLNGDAKYTLMEGLLAFVIGFYLREHGPIANGGKWRFFAGYLLVMAAYGIERVAVRSLGMEHANVDEAMRYALLLLAASLLFCFMLRVKMAWTWPSRIAPHILSIYLITAGPGVAKLLYEQLLSIGQVSHTIWLMPFYVAVNTLLVIFCVTIDRVVSRINKKECRVWLRMLGAACGCDTSL